MYDAVCGLLITEGIVFGGSPHYPSIPIVVLAGLLTGMAVGALNGLLVARLSVPPFIATLGTLYIARGTALLISNGHTFPNLAGDPSRSNTGFTSIGQSFLFGIPTPVWLMAIIAVLAAAVAAKTPFGRHIYAVGGNERAARLAGIRTERVKIATYVFSGLCAALVGIIIASQLEAAHPATGESFELNAIAAVVLGGTSLMGRTRVHRRLAHRRVRHRRACGWAGDARRLRVLADRYQRSSHRTRRRRRPATGSCPVPFSYDLSTIYTAGDEVMRYRSLLLAGMLLLSLAGCNRGEQPEKRLIAIIVPSQDNPFFQSGGGCSSGSCTLARLSRRCSRADAHNDSDAYRQDNLIDAAIASIAAAIILDKAGSDASISAVRRAVIALIACILIDREIDAIGIAKAQIISDNAQGARIVAEAFSHTLGPKAHYAELLGRESDTNAQIRTRSFHAVLDKLPGLTLVNAQSANWSQSEAFQKTETMLQAHPEISGIIAGNDTMALGAAAAVQRCRSQNVFITGLDGSPDAIAAITRSELLATALQPAVLISRMAVDQADQLLRTGSTGQPEKQVIPCDLVTKENAADFSNFDKIR